MFFSASGHCHFLMWPRNYCSYIHTGRDARGLPSREMKAIRESCPWGHYWTVDHTVPGAWFLLILTFQLYGKKNNPSLIRVFLIRFMDNLFLSQWLCPYFWLLLITHGTNDKTILISLWFHFELPDKIQEAQLNLNCR